MCRLARPPKGGQTSTHTQALESQVFTQHFFQIYPNSENHIIQIVMGFHYLDHLASKQTYHSPENRDRHTSISPGRNS